MEILLYLSKSSKVDTREGNFQLRNFSQLVYNIEEEQRLAENSERYLSPVHFPVPEGTGLNQSMLVQGDPSNVGWEIAAVNTHGEIIGTGRFNEAGQCGLAVWGELNFPGKNIPQSDPAYQLRVWDGNSEYPAELELSEGQTSSSFLFEPDGFIAGKLIAKPLPTEFALTDIYPNPFNSQTKLNYALPEHGHVNLVIYDLNGRMIKKLVSMEKAAGYHSFVINANDYSSGMYLAQLTWNRKSQTRKFVVVK